MMDANHTIPWTPGADAAREAPTGLPVLICFVAVVWLVSVEGVAREPAAQVPPASAAATGSIAGRVELGHVEPAPARRPEVAALGAPPARDLPDRRVSVVYLETAPRGAFEETKPGRAALDQRNETFVPHVLAVTTGTVVDFPNNDRIYHNVFSLSKVARFDLGRYAEGRSKPVRFDRPGIVRVFCDIHSHMSAFILVFSHPFFAVTDADGRFRIDRVPAGTYDLIAWNEGTTSDPQPVRVPAGGVVDDVEFTLR